MKVNVLFEDTRNKKGKHKNIHAYCKENGIQIVRQSLNVGDYQVANRGDIVVDTKMGVAEIAGNIFQDHERFREECKRARLYRIQLIVLIEEQLPGGRLDNWRSPIGWDGLPMHKFNPETLRKAMITMQEEYGVKFRFCSPQETGCHLIDYLTGVRT